MTFASAAAVRLRDLRKASRIAKLNAAAAIAVFSAAGLTLPHSLEAATSGQPYAAVAFTGFLLGIGLGCLFVVDRELREVSA